MNLLDSPLDGFSPELYLSTLSKLAHSDGIHSAEQEILDHHAERLGIDLDNLPDVPDDLMELPWVTRVLVYRDAVMLALADEDTSDVEQQYLSTLAERMQLPESVVGSISDWVQEYGELLERLDALLGDQT